MPTEQIRNIALIGLCLFSLLIYQKWQADFAPRPAGLETGEAEVESLPAPLPLTVPNLTEGDSFTSDSPLSELPVPQVGLEESLEATTPEHTTEGWKGIEVVTDTMIVHIDPRGAVLRRLELPKYPVSVDDQENGFALLKPLRNDFFVAQTGVVGAGPVTTHGQTFSATASSFSLAEDADTLTVPLTWKNDTLDITIRYIFTRNSYKVDVQLEVVNHGDASWAGRIYGQFERTPPEPEGGIFRTYTYTGGIYSTPQNPYEKMDFGDIRDAEEELRKAQAQASSQKERAELKSRTDVQSTGGWVAMIQHYFAGAFIPPPDETYNFYTKHPKDNRYIVGLYSPAKRIPAGSRATFDLELYAGPKVQEQMREIAPHLHRTVDYGWLWFIADPLFWLLRFIHDYLNNWGWSIIALTLLIKLAFFHLSATSYKSMARMRKVQPRIVALRDRYQDDKQRMNQAMMDLYKTEKINPLSGCLPILVQIPVFIALYWVLLESVELRQATFLWLEDLSINDPYFVLPVAMGVTMLAQQRLNPTPPDPVQARVMMALPFVFTVFFLFFPSGLVLYWFVNNLLSIAQQWVITKKIVGPDPPASPS